MTKPATTTPPPAQPTADDVQQVSAAVAQAAAAAPTADQARTDAAAAARQAADKVKLEIGDEEIKAISNGVVAAMEARGAFDTPIEPVSPPPTATGPSSEPVSTTAAPAGTPPATVEQPPRKRSFAQRFLGDS